VNGDCFASMKVMIALNANPAGAVRLHGQVTHRIGKAILSGDLKPGQPLDAEQALGPGTKVSRVIFREAMRTLSAKGLVEARPRAGTRVTSRDQWHILDPDVVAWMFASEPDMHLVERLFELRRMVEPEAAALAAERCSGEHVRRLETAISAMTQFGLQDPRGQAADSDFHGILLEATDNPYVQALAKSLATAASLSTKFKSKDVPWPRDPVVDHKEVYDAIAAADPQAARRAMLRLLNLALIDTKAVVAHLADRKKTTSVQA